jgi:DNA-binding LacI/PurR family transcriptional regulator
MAENDRTASRRPTIYDLAQLTGTSPSAVSSVLNGTWKKRRISARTAERVTRIAAEQGYAVNLQASLLRREKSHIIGMIVPKYDNRYFGAIAEQFEVMARARGLFPVITCTQRDPDLELEAARELISYQVEYLVVTGATDPDRISDLCKASGVRAINLDLPGSKAPSVVSDNYGGAYELTLHILSRQSAELGIESPLWFIGGRSRDHNTAQRLKGFLQAHREKSLEVPEDRVIIPGYSPAKIIAALDESSLRSPSGLFVNSTIALEGVVRWLSGNGLLGNMRFGCFDWDPFAALLASNVGMAAQDVGGMLERVFILIEEYDFSARSLKVPCKLHMMDMGGRLARR